MTQKLLLIIKGEHTDPALDETAVAEVMQCHKVQLELILAIARYYKKIGYFSDYMLQDDVDFYNEFLEKYLASKTTQEKQLRIESIIATGKAIKMPELGEEYSAFATMASEGIKVILKKTEEKLDIEAILRGNIPDNEYRDLVQVVKGKDPSILQWLDRYAYLFFSWRDTNVFSNVMAQAESANVLFMGLQHPLKDFKEEPHEFMLYQVKIRYTNGRVEMEGELPLHLETVVRSMEKRNLLTTDVRYR